jgi:predicted transcriptional regulator
MTPKTTKPNPMQDALDVVAKVFADPDAFPRDFVAFPLRGEMVSRILTAQRRRIIVYLEDHGPVNSIRSLADALGRDPAAVSRDIHLLTDAGLLRVEDVGRSRHVHATGRPIIVA